MQVDTRPNYLYKILSWGNWKASQDKVEVVLSSVDDNFIHLATEEQLDRIIDKYWRDVLSFVILKIDVQQLVGKLVLEANPSGTNKYYHLYQGLIPLYSIVEVKVIDRSKSY